MHTSWPAVHEYNHDFKENEGQGYLVAGIIFLWAPLPLSTRIADNAERLSCKNHLSSATRPGFFRSFLGFQFQFELAAHSSAARYKNPVDMFLISHWLFPLPIAQTC